jgi:bifunctional non-homologous end joining protein LigD
MEEAVKLAAGDTGAFIIDGERYYRSVTGSEHRTAAQCATANAEAGQPTVLPVPVFAAFEALFANGRDLTNQGKLARIEAASGIVAIIHSYLPADARCAIEHLTPAISTTEKRNLARSQGDEGREGEVWTYKYAPYTGGKKHGKSFRTKYLEEAFFYIVGVKYSTADGRSIASFQLEDENGKAVGSVGSGFDEATGLQLAKEVEAGGRPKVEVKFQGRTETGMLWHSRMI